MVNPNSVLTITMLSSFSTPFMLSAVNVALPSIGHELNLDAIALGRVSLVFLLSSASLLVPMGRAADIYGRKNIFTTGFVIFTAASLFCGLAGSQGTLLAARAVQGLGASMIFGTAVAMLTSVFPAHQRGRAIGYVSASVYIGLTLGPFLGGMLTHFISWRAIFLVNVPLGLFVLYLVRVSLPGTEWIAAQGEAFDLPGALLYTCALILITLGLSQGASGTGVVMTGGGITLLTLFLNRDNHVPHPILNAGVLAANRVFVYSNLAAFLNYSATFAAGFLLSLYLQYAKAMDPRQAGLLLICQPLVMVALSPWAGRLSDRMDPGLIASTGMGLTAVGLLLFAWPQHGLPLWRIVTGLCTLGAGLALFSAPNTNAVMGSVDKKHYSLASSTLATMRITGQLFSMTVVMFLFNFLAGRTRLGPENLQGLAMAFNAGVWIFSGLAALGVAASLMRQRPAQKTAEQI